MLIETAAHLAFTSHEGQVNKFNDEPYIFHPMRCANAALRNGENDIIVASLWLHDVLEDTECNTDILLEHVGIEVAQIVAQLTKQKRISNKDYYAYLQDKQLARIAKIYDLKDNLSRLDQIKDFDTQQRLAHKYALGLSMLKAF